MLAAFVATVAGVFAGVALHGVVRSEAEPLCSVNVTLRSTPLRLSGESSPVQPVMAAVKLS